MLKLLKYEILKQKSSKLMLGAFLLIFEAVYLIGILGDIDAMLSLGIIGLSITAFAGFVVVALEAIVTYQKDLNEKQGYMVFMTPHSEASILGAKILSSILTIVVWTVFICLLAFLDITILSFSFGVVQELIEFIRDLGSAFYGITISWTSALYSAVYVVLEWINILLAAFFAITLAHTFLHSRKYSGLISFVIFIVCNVISQQVLDLVEKIFGLHRYPEMSFSIEASADGISTASSGLALTGAAFAVTLIFTIIYFLCSKELLKRKLAL